MVAHLTMIPSNKSLLLNERVYDHVHSWTTRSWQHRPFFGHDCWLHARIPHWRGADGGTRMAKVPWARRGSSLSLAFERHCLELLQAGATVEKVSKEMGIYPQQLWGILRYWAPRLCATERIEGPTRLAILDIPTTGRQHMHLTLIVDLGRGRVLQALGGGPSETPTDIMSWLKDAGQGLAAIAYAFTGLSKRDIESYRQHFPQAKVVVGRHYVVELVRETLEETQRLTHGDGRVDELADLFGRLWEMADAEAAAGCLAYCCDRARESSLAPLVTLADTIWACWEAVRGSWDVGIPHSTLEDLYGEVVSIVRSGRGYRDPQHLSCIVLVRMGGLPFDAIL